MKKWKICFCVIMMLVSQRLRAQEVKKPEPPMIRVQGHATVTAKPDEVVIQISVITQAARADEAAKQNAQKSDQVIQKVRSALSSAAEIRTTGYNVAPDYRYPTQGGQPEIVGYTVSNTIEVRTGKLDRVGDVIDAAISSGANNITGLTFRLKDESPVASEALKQATKKARAKADAIAAALGVHIVRVLKVEEGFPTVIPIQERAMMMAKSADVAAETPIESGTIEVQADVTLTVEID